MNNQPNKTTRGYVLIFAIVFVAVMTVLTGALVSYSSINRVAESSALVRAQSLYIAEAGIDKAIQMLNQDASYTGETNTAFGEGTFTTVITSIDQFTKKITSTSNVTDPSGRTTVRTINAVAEIDTETVSFSYGVQVGQGGLTLDNNAIIEGNVFASGNITGNGTITGDATVTVQNSSVADAQSTATDSDFLFGNTNARANTAVSFTPSFSESLTGVQVYLKKTGTPSNITLKIVSDNNGSPSKTVLASGTVSASAITSNYSWINTTLTSNPSVSAGTTYWIILIASVNVNNYYSWGIQSSLTGGKYSTNWNANSPVWTPAGGRFAYKTFLGDVPTYLSGVTVNGTVRAPSLLDCIVGGNAYYETTNTCDVGGSSFPNTPSTPAVAMPISDAQIDEWESIAEAGGVYNGAYTINETATLGPYKINGDLALDNGATLYLTGPLWVNGSITIENNSHIYVHSSLGNMGTIIIADYIADTTQKGLITIDNNSQIAGNGGAASFPLVISTYSGASNAIDINNNAASTIFYAPYGTIDLNNNASVKEMTAHAVHLNNNAIVDYETGLQDTHFSTGPGGSWTFQPGSYVITE